MKKNNLVTFVFCEPTLHSFLERIYDIILKINATLLLSHGIRRNREAIIVIKDLSKALVLRGRYIRNYRPDFQSASGLILKVLLRGDEGRGLKTIPLQTLLTNVSKKQQYIVKEGRHVEIPSKIASANAVVLFPSTLKFKCLNLTNNYFYITIPGIEKLREHQIATILNIELDGMVNT